MGGGKGVQILTRGKSDNELMRFCQSFMTELSRHWAQHRCTCWRYWRWRKKWLFGQYKRLRNEFTGVLTGKGINWGGSLIRPEATGYGTVYFAQNMMATKI